MSNHAAIFRQVLETDPQWLEQIRRGVEKESLRVTADQATLAQTSHPEGLGSTLTHPAITTDYSEALLEFIITIRIKDQTGEETFFKVKRTTKMAKVFEAYASREGVRANALRFLRDGVIVNPDRTSADLGLEDQDVIDSDDGTITIRIKDQTGKETFFKVKHTTKMAKVFAAYASRKGVHANALRFLLDGERLREEETPAMYNMEEQDQIDVLLEQTGTVGFGPHTNTPGRALLMNSGGHGSGAGGQTHAQHASSSPDLVRGLVRQLGGDPNASFQSFRDDDLLSHAARETLLRHLHGNGGNDNNGVCGTLGGHSTTGNDSSVGGDMKISLSLDALRGLVGEDTVHRLLHCFSHGDTSIGGGCGTLAPLACNRISLRRVRGGTDHCIKFHRDEHTVRTMQVPLNGESEYTGGRLVYAGGDGILRYPARPVGSVTIHGGNIVHGVTALRAGSRHGLFLLHVPDT